MVAGRVSRRGRHKTNRNEFRQIDAEPPRATTLRAEPSRAEPSSRQKKKKKKRASLVPSFVLFSSVHRETLRVFSNPGLILFLIPNRRKTERESNPAITLLHFSLRLSNRSAFSVVTRKGFLVSPISLIATGTDKTAERTLVNHGRKSKVQSWLVSVVLNYCVTCINGPLTSLVKRRN